LGQGISGQHQGPRGIKMTVPTIIAPQQNNP
jgi:hypothetical protein